MNAVKKNVLGCVVVFAASVACGQVTVDAFLTGEGNVTDLTVSHMFVDPAAGPEGATVFDLRLDSPDDILVIDAQVEVTTGSIFCYQDHADGRPFGPMCVRPNIIPALVEIFGEPEGTWIDTPGGTVRATATTLDSGMLVTYFDTTSDPFVDDFRFARITLTPNEDGIAAATLSGRIQTAGDSVQFNHFEVALSSVVPEPDGMYTILLAMVGVFAGRSRLRLAVKRLSLPR